jgi:hypothetical protein
MEQNAFYNYGLIARLHLADSIITQSEGFKYLKHQDLLTIMAKQVNYVNALEIIVV